MGMRRLDFAAAAIAACCIGGIVFGQAGSQLGGFRLTDDALKLSHEEASWMDVGFGPIARAVLDSTRGYAPPAFPDELEWPNGQAPNWGDLRGKVVVLQTWTNASSTGRQAPRRVGQMLKRFSDVEVELINLHTPEGVEQYADYAERMTNLTVALDPVGRYCDEFGAYKQPVTIIIDRSGAIRYSGVSLRGVVPAVKKLAAEPFDADAPAPRALPSRDARDLRIRPDANPAPTGPAWPLHLNSVDDANDMRGEQAPELYVAEWLNGMPSTGNKVVMVEFWATWCGPCRRGIPKLNKFQAKYRDDLTIIGVSDEDPNKVRNFMKTERFVYTVAVDPDKVMAEEVGHRGIPHAYVVSPDGIVRWQGNPHDLTESAIEQIIEASGLGDETPVSSGAGQVERWVR